MTEPPRSIPLQPTTVFGGPPLHDYYMIGVDVRAEKSWTKSRLLHDIRYSAGVPSWLWTAKRRQEKRDEDAVREYMGSWI